MSDSIAILDALTVACWTAACLRLLGWMRPGRQIHLNVVLSGLTVFSLLYSVFLFLGWSGINEHLEHVEDLLGVTLPVWWAFTFYALSHQLISDDLRRSKLELTHAQTVARVASWRLELADGMLHWSEAVHALLADDNAPPATRADWVKTVQPDDRAQVESHWESAMRGAPYACEYRVIRAGAETWIQENVQFEFSGRHTPVRATGTVQDISERKRAETLRTSLEAQLRQAQKLEAVGQLAGGVAHDFNNILTAILGNTELALNLLGREDAAAQPALHPLTQIRKSAERAAALTRQLLAFSRNHVVRPDRLDLNRIIHGLQDMLIRLLKEDITIEIIAGRDLQCVEADANQLEQVIVNLVVNASDAMPHGGQLTLETRNVVLDEHYVAAHTDARVGQHVVLRVSDTGTGIPTDIRERIFEPFFTTKPVGKGTGLGLAMAHGIVTQAGGHITVQSEPGCGTTFQIYLPAQACARALPQPAAKPVEHRGSETILLTDDDALLRELIARQLRSAGYTVLPAGGGAEALALARDHGGIDLLVTDVVMPEMNGRELSDRLTQQQPNLPTLFISGYTANVIGENGVLPEDVDFLEKPFTRDVLLARVRAVLDRQMSVAKR